MNTSATNPAVTVDPLARPRRVLRAWAAGSAVCVPLAVWACWSAAVTRVDAQSTARPTNGRSSAGAPGAQRPALELAAFDAPIWTFDPPPPAPVAPPAPLRLQLVGIVGDASGGALRAVLYNQETDELVVVEAGEKVGVRTVVKVEAAGVTLSDGRRLLMEGGNP